MIEKKVKTNNKKKETTSWGGVSSWYKKVVDDNDSYQTQVIKPNLRRILNIKKGDVVLDLACGEGKFARLAQSLGAKVIGTDIAGTLIGLAKKEDIEKQINFFVTESHKLEKIQSESLDLVFCVLAIQNIEKVKETFLEVNRCLKKSGRFILVINHPSFRNPRKTDWGYDENKKVQYRRTEEYMSESKVEIDMNPGERNPKKKKYTITFHRPLQFFFKNFKNNGFAITSLEEWTSHKESEKGPKSEQENKSRHEIPMFMSLEGIKIN